MHVAIDRIGRSSVLALALVVVGGAAARAAESDGPVGVWKTVDDRTGRGRAVVRIDVADGVLTGRIESSLDPRDPPDARCTACTGDRKDQPIRGMPLLAGLREDGDPRHWSGGEIVDPDSGKVYRAKLVVAPDGRTLTVRGYLGIPLFGRSQTWLRLPAPTALLRPGS